VLLSFSLLPWLAAGVSGGGRISDVMVGNGASQGSTSSSSPSSQRSTISGGAAAARDAFGAVAEVKDESFDCPVLSFFGFDVSAAAEPSALGRLREG